MRRPTRARDAAEIRQVQTRGKATVEQVLCGVHLVRSVVDVNDGHTYLHGQRCSRMCRSKSSRKYLIAVCSGSAAPGASAQKVFPGAHMVVCAESLSRSPGCPRPSSMDLRIRSAHPSPLQHGVQKPQDSRAKKRVMFHAI